MNILIPVSQHDKHLLPDFTAVLQHFGGLNDHKVLFLATPSAKEEAYEAAAALGAEAHVFNMDFQGGWPSACSNHFATAVHHLGRAGNTEPFLWMELDMLPVAKNWPTLLLQEYRRQGQPFLGNWVPTPWNVGGKVVTKDGDNMMMGCGVYPPNMERDERFKPLIADLAKTGARCPRDPFDVYLRWSIKHTGVANTDFIADMWQTKNYRREGDSIVCDAIPQDKPCRPRSGAIPPSAVLVHGCKDGSLARLLLTADAVKAVKAPKSFDVVEVLKPMITQDVIVVPPPVVIDSTPKVIDPPKPLPDPIIVPNDKVVLDALDDDEEPPPPQKPRGDLEPVRIPSPPLVSTASKITRPQVLEGLDAMKGKKKNVHNLAVKLRKITGIKDLAAKDLTLTVFPLTGFKVLAGGWVESTI